MTSEILTAFLKRWPLDSVKKMTLKEYTGLENPDTFTQWVETKTRSLGSIRGWGSIKFGIYKRKDPEKRHKNSWKDDSKYTWMKKFGETRREAFKQIRNCVVKTIECAQNGNFETIDEIQLPDFYKWKIACLYSNQRLVSIFKKSVLVDIYGHYAGKTKGPILISKVQRLMMKNKPSNLSVHEFMIQLDEDFNQAVDEDSKQSRTNNLKAEVFYTGLKALAEGPKKRKSIENWTKKHGEFSEWERASTDGDRPRIENIFVAHFYEALKAAKFIRRREEERGEWVITDKGRVAIGEFESDKIGLVFHADAEYRRSKAKKEGAGRSSRKSERLRNVFKFKAGMPKHKTKETIRKPVSATVVRRIERELHKILYKQLKEEHGYKNVSSDLGRAWGNCEADLIVQHSNGIDIYEVKSAITSRECVRQALGQLFVYGFWPIESSGGNDEVLRLIAAGSGKLDSDTKAFLEKLNNLLRIPVSYRRIEQET